MTVECSAINGTSISHPSEASGTFQKREQNVRARGRGGVLWNIVLCVMTVTLLNSQQLLPAQDLCTTDLTHTYMGAVWVQETPSIPEDLKAVNDY